MKNIDSYIEASGENPQIKTHFDRLVSRIPTLSTDPTEATIQIKEALYQLGFSYDSRVFKAQDVIKERKGNCLGLPLLIGAIMQERELNPQFQIVVNPKDSVYKFEGDFFKRLNDEIRYDNPQLATEQEEFPICRFQPLEHLLLDTNGTFFIEATSEEHPANEYESARPLTYQQALSLVYKDRGLDAEDKGIIKEAKKLAEEGLKLWPKNRSLIINLAHLLDGNGRGEKFTELIKEHEKCGGNDSLFYFERYQGTRDITPLNKALEIYPMFAQAIAMKGSSLSEKDQREARFQYALASHLHANSNVLSLRDFYAIHSKDIKRLFGETRVKQILQGFVK